MEAGLDLLNNMFRLLLRFREQSIAVSADNEGIFKQKGIKQSDQYALRFLRTSKNGLKQYWNTRLLFGAK